MKKFFGFIFLFSIGFYMMGCSAEETIQKEELQEQQAIEMPTETVQPVEVSYDFTGRFLLTNSNILFDRSDESIVFDDPIVSEFVQFLKGDKYTFVFHKFEFDPISKEKSNEIVFAFETSNIETGIRIVPEQFVYYYLNYKDSRSRIDGEKITGDVIIDTIDNEFISGNLSFSIDGKRKEFDKEDVDVTAEFKGNFKIPIVDINTNLR